MIQIQVFQEAHVSFRAEPCATELCKVYQCLAVRWKGHMQAPFSSLIVFVPRTLQAGILLLRCSPYQVLQGPSSP